MSTKKYQDSHIGKLVRRALVRAGKAIPQTEAEVAEAEESLALAKTKVPQRLMDPYLCLDPKNRLVRTGGVPQEGEDKEAAELLARAAREGGEIAADVEERMKADRDAAEGKPDGDE